MGPLGVQELILIFVVALLIFGPKKLPELGKSLGKGLREFKKATEDLKQSWDQQMRDADVTGEINRTIRDVEKDLKQTARELETENSSTDPAAAAEPSKPEDQAVSKEHA